MEAAQAAGGGAYSSSVELSSPPSESEVPPSLSPTPHAQLLHEAANAANSTIRVGAVPARSGGDEAAASSAPATLPQSASHTAPAAPTPAAKVKKPRKKREPAPADAPPKEKKTRRPRAASGGATVASRKKQKTDNQVKVEETKPQPAPAPTRQSKITDLVSPAQPPQPTQSFGVASEPQNAQNGKHEAIPTPQPYLSPRLVNQIQPQPQSQPQPQPQQPPQPQIQSQQPPQSQFRPTPSQQPEQNHPQPQPAPTRSSGQNYDPIRSAATETNTVSHNPFSPPPNATPPRTYFRASASPAISSIIDPPPNLHMSAQQSQQQQPPPPAFPQVIKTSPIDAGSQPLSSPSASQISPFQPSIPAAASALPSSSAAPPPTQTPAAMEIDSDSPAAIPKPATLVKKGTSSGAPSNAPSPKPARAKEQPPPLPQGSGLLSSAFFGVEDASASSLAGSGKTPNIIIHVPLRGQMNKVINFARLAEERYGFAALHPRLAAQKDRLARVAAASAALEKKENGGKSAGISAGESGDEDMSLDIDRDSDNDGDVAMSGTNGAGLGTGANSGAEGASTGVKKKRKKKIEEYDREDPFVDDTELAWEAQAAASKDGFFVYSGPLVPEGEKVAVERADGTVKRGRGRGRGGGPGSRGGRGGAAAAARDSEGGTSRGGGPGSRGGTTTRKPRITKAGRALMERERLDREKMAVLAAKPTGYPG